MVCPCVDYVFESAEESLKWAVEVLRLRRLPRTAGFWREIEAEAEWVAGAWEGTKNLGLPKTSEERMGLALKVMGALDEVGARDAEAAHLLRLWVGGDWADERRLAAAMAIQEKCRREGIRVKLAYRYTYEQLGALLGCDRKAAWRKVQDALALLGDRLGQKGLLPVVEVPEQEENHFKKSVYSDDFKIECE